MPAAPNTAAPVSTAAASTPGQPRRDNLFNSPSKDILLIYEKVARHPCRTQSTKHGQSGSSHAEFVSLLRSLTVNVNTAFCSSNSSTMQPAMPPIRFL